VGDPPVRGVNGDNNGGVPAGRSALAGIADTVYMRRILLSILIVAALSACSSGDQKRGYACDDPVSHAAPRSADSIAVTGDLGLTDAMGIDRSPTVAGATEIGWSPAYSITNLSDARACVYDITVEFMARRDEKGRLLSMRTVSGSRSVDIYRDNAAREAKRPTASQVPPFGVEAGDTILVQLRQGLAFSVDGVDQRLALDDDLPARLSPLLGMQPLGGGDYQCVAESPGLRATTQSSAGTWTTEVNNPVLVAGCILAVPDRPAPGEQPSTEPTR
jgi:hypothetical protein